MDDLETTLQNVDPIVWIVIAAVVVIAIVAILLVVNRRSGRVRTERLRSRFGREYDRTVEREGSTSKAEKELEARLERRGTFSLRQLSTERRQELLVRWEDVQASFVDGPESAVRTAEVLVDEAARDRGYPDADSEQRLRDLAFDHSDEVHRYREATETGGRGGKKGDVDEAEVLRRRMLAARELFETIVGPGESRRPTTSRDATPPVGRSGPSAERDADGPGTGRDAVGPGADRGATGAGTDRDVARGSADRDATRGSADRDATRASTDPDGARTNAASAAGPEPRPVADRGRRTDPRGEPLAGTPPRSEEHTVTPPPPRSEERTITPPPPPMPGDR